MGTRERSGHRDQRQMLLDRFNERLANGQTFYVPCLGWKEFVPSHFGLFREKDRTGNPVAPCREVNLTIPSLLRSMWEHRKLAPVFRQNWEIVEGVMSYEYRRPDLAE